jgi:cyclohexadieny/prephenate dehydrogenase
MSNDTIKPLFNVVAIIGIGLIGSSIARAIKKYGLASKVYGYAKTDSTRNTAKKLGYMDEIYDNAIETVKDADLTILCIPVGANLSVIMHIGEHLKPGSVLTDVGSVKGSVIKDIVPHISKEIIFIPGHPIAGTEFSGPESGFAEIFQKKWCILTPSDNCIKVKLDLLIRFWESCGMFVDVMSAEHHDLVLAITSHVPHLIAYNIVGTASDLEKVTRSEVTKYAAGGFRDFTRIASSDPVMWRDIFLNNKEAVLEMLGRFVEDLTALQKAIRWSEGDKLEELFLKTREIRKSIILKENETDNLNEENKV